MKLRTAILCIVILLGINMANKAIGQNEDVKIWVDNVSYDYEMTDSNGFPDCSGTMKCTIHVTPGIKRIILGRSRTHVMKPNDYMIVVKREYNLSDNQTDIDVAIDNCSWGQYFRAWAVVPDDHWVHTPFFSTNDYINPEDLKMILDAAGVEDVETDAEDAIIKVDGKRLTVDVSGSISLSVADLNGRSIFNGEVKQSTVIPLDCVTTPFVVVRYVAADKVFTKKFIVR